jgi:large subunit ribosomal protein L11
MIIKLLVDGGSMKPGPALSQKLGPAGININQVIQKVNDATKNMPGLKVPVDLEVDTSTREFEIRVFSPPVAELLKKELNVTKGSGAQKKLQIANASIEQVISVAKTKFQNMLCRDLKSAVKTVVGSCVSLGILVENKNATEVEAEIDAGKYDREIKGEITQTPPEKRKEMDKYFADVQGKQERILKQEKAAQEAEEEKKASAKDAKKPATPAAATPAKAAPAKK